MRLYICLICKKEIDDDGDNFCSKCREKDWKLRFMAIAKADKVQGVLGKRVASYLYHSNRPKIPRPYTFRTYWERRRDVL